MTQEENAVGRALDGDARTLSRVGITVTGWTGRRIRFWMRIHVLDNEPTQEAPT